MHCKGLILGGGLCMVACPVERDTDHPSCQGLGILIGGKSGADGAKVQQYRLHFFVGVIIALGKIVAGLAGDGDLGNNVRCNIRMDTWLTAGQKKHRQQKKQQFSHHSTPFRFCVTLFFVLT